MPSITVYMWLGGDLKSFCFTKAAAAEISLTLAARNAPSAGFLNLFIVTKRAGCRLTREMNWLVTVVTWGMFRAAAASDSDLQEATTEDCHCLTSALSD